jgi:uracil DNA glycosylase
MKILPKEKYYPEANKVLRIFSVPFDSIKVVMIGAVDDPKLTSQGVFIIPYSFTRGVEMNHNIFWYSFIKKIVYLIAKYNPCIWILKSSKAQSFTANIPVKNRLNVTEYDDFTIKTIPSAEYFNYILLGDDINLEYVNIILSKRGLNQINF